MKAIQNLIIFTFLAANVLTSCAQRKVNMQNTDSRNIQNNKLVIYQMMVRLFGNKNTTNKTYGSIEENGSGKFNDISDKALIELKKLGISHVWYTGVLEQATMTDNSQYGIKSDDPDIVKGRAGSPYAIKDYYDVSPDLAVDVKNRMTEFEWLISRTHHHGLKVIMDFVPNHVARTYNSDAKPAGVIDFGANDNVHTPFDPQNDFYYVPGKPFIIPVGTNAGGDFFQSPLKDNQFAENPAKATGNNVFSEAPTLNDWSETIKLNYGVDYLNGEKHYFEPMPPVWIKMKDILTYWAKKNVDGFRCDMSEMVPIEFWNWVIPEVKKVNPDIIFIAEAYNPKLYEQFLTTGKFDFLYDKVGLYDGLKRLIRNEDHADVKDISYVVNHESAGFSAKMLRFLENHDEERIASEGFAKDPKYALPAMVVSATLSGGPVMLYFGQEVGEPGHGIEGFGGNDNRTSIFDYWGVPEHQKWMNGGRFDGGKLSDDQKELRDFYAKLLNFSARSEAIGKGEFMELKNPAMNNRMYAFVRYTDHERVLVVANFDRAQTLDTHLILPESISNQIGKKAINYRELISNQTQTINSVENGIPIVVPPSSAVIISF
ncbi:MAG: tvaII [Daejeonella sp.]|nr:tvaII [Daejeonella sp.]